MILLNMLEKISDPYEIFSSLYDYNSNIALKKELFNFMIPKLANFNSTEILDFACGTGNLSILFAIKGFRVIGVDKSINMLSLAKSKLPSDVECCSFINASFSNFLFDLNRFHACFCNSFALNYLHSFEELEEVFEKIFHSLCSGGYFVFDLILPEFAESHFQNRVRVLSQNSVKICTSFAWESSCFDKYIINYRFINSDEKNLGREIHTGCAFSPNRVKKRLEGLGFNLFFFGVQKHLFGSGNPDLLQVIAIKNG